VPRTMLSETLARVLGLLRPRLPDPLPAPADVAA
jgi:hypothetical protein